MEGFQEAARMLAGRAGRTLPFQPSFLPLDGKPHGPVIAVDGSHAVLADSGAAWVAAVTAVAVPFPGSWPHPPPKVHATLPGEAQAALDAAYSHHGLEAPRADSAESWATALRELAEFSAAQAALASLPPEGLLLVDGALHGLPRIPAARMASLAAAAGPRLVAVAKRSLLDASGVPLVPALHAAGPATCWTVDVPGHAGVHVARFHPRATHSFRVDTVGGERVADILGRLVPLARDAAYLGYPYPLAAAHNAVALTTGRVAELKARLESALRREGAPAWRLTDDFHRVLDRSVPG